MTRQSERKSNLPPYDDLPETVRTAFANRTLLTLPEVARLLTMDVKTPLRHVEANDITCRYKGAGAKRRHRVFTIADVSNYLRSTRVGAEQLEELEAAWLGKSVRIGAMNMTLRRRRRKTEPSLRLVLPKFMRQRTVQG